MPLSTTQQSPWLTAKEAGCRGRVGAKVIYRESKAGRLRHARVGGRRELRFRPEWIDQWLEQTAEPVEVRR
jgi:excisionase family DNA binding protein